MRLLRSVYFEATWIHALDGALTKLSENLEINEAVIRCLSDKASRIDIPLRHVDAIFFARTAV